jgi:SRSO17 transposase
VTTHQGAAAAVPTITHDLPERLRGELLERIAPCFPRRDTRSGFRDLLQGLLMELETRNCWTVAEAVGHASPDRLQYLVGRACWDERAVLDAAAAWAVGHLDDGDAVLIADETGDAKSSTDAVGAARQYSGALGGVGLCQVAVHLVFATARGHAVIDRALYLPERWAADDERRERAGVCDEVAFATKPAQALAMLRRAHATGMRAGFFAGDEVYGSRELRAGCRDLGLGYAVAVRADHRVTLPSGRLLEAAEAPRLIPARAWQRMRTGTGSKGARDYDWAMMQVRADDVPGDGQDAGESVLLIRRHRYTGTLSFYRCWSPRPVTLARLVSVVCRRWKIEELFQLAKGVTGLDQGQVTRWTSWHRWSCAALVAYAFLAVATALTAPIEQEATERESRTDPDLPLAIALTSRELLRLLRQLLLPAPRRDRDHVHRWSLWRRRHQHRAREAHRRWHAYADATP